MGATAPVRRTLSIPVGRFWILLRKYWLLYLMLLPGVAYFLIFRYGPMYGIVIAFKDYRVLEGIVASPWVGFKHFQALFTGPYFGRIMKNTLTISLLKLVVGFPPPIILALMLNEVRFSRLKRIIQTVSYLPHFLSWIIISGILFAFLAPSGGLINEWMKAAGGQPIPFMTHKTWFLVVLVVSEIWKEAGWGAIIYLAALSGISPDLYEAATMDGANRLQQMRHISLPGIASVIILMLILRMGYMLDAGFEQIYILYTPQVYQVADIIDTWVFRNGIEQFRFSLATAAGVFKSAVGIALLLTANKLAKQWAEQGIW